jgi:predicted small metal-binding protein
LVDDGTLLAWEAGLDVMGFLEQVRTSCGPQSLSKRRMPGLGVCGSSGASKTPLSWPLGSIVPWGVTKDARAHLRKGHGLDLVDDGTRSRGRRGSTLWVFWNKSALRADLRVFQSVGCRALGCVVPRGPQKHLFAGPWGASYRGEVTKDARAHLRKGHGLDLVDDGTHSRGRRGSTLWVFWNKSALRADLRVFQSVGCRALGCVVPRGPQKHLFAGPWGASYRGEVTKDARAHLRKGHGLDLVDDGICSRGRRGSTLWVFWNKSALRADLRVFQSVGCRALGCVVPRGPQKHLFAGPWGASYRGEVTKDARAHLRKGHGLDLVDDGICSRGRRGSTLWVFWNKSALRADLRVFQSVGCRALGCVVPRGPQKHLFAGPWGASYRGEVTKDARAHLRKGHGLDLVDDGICSRGRRGSTLWVFWNKSALRADLRVFQSVGCRALGCVVPRGPQKHLFAGPWGASYRGEVTKDARAHLRKENGLDLVDDGICSRGRRGSTLWVFWNKSALRADLRVFQSVGCRALGCVVPRGPQKHLFAGPWGASYRGEVTKDARAHLRKGHGLDLVDDGICSRGRRGSTLWVFWNKSALRADLRVFQSVGCRALGCVVPRGPQKHLFAGPWGASYRGEVTKDARAHLRKGHGLDLVDDGTCSRGRRGSTLWVFWNKSALRADLRVFQSVGCRALGCVVPRGPQKHLFAGPWGASYRGEVTKDARAHLRKGHGLDLVDDGTCSRGRRGSTLWVFWNKSALRADLRVFQSVGCRALGCVVPRGPQKHLFAGPWGASYRGEVTKDARAHLRKGHGLDLVDDGICSRGRRGSTLWVFWNKSALRADLRVFQSVGCRGLGCVVPRGPQKHLFAGPWGASYRGEVTKDARAHLRKGRGLDLVDDGIRSRGRRGSTLWVFWNKSALRADLRVFQSVGCRALGCVVPRGAQKHLFAGPWGASYRGEVTKDARAHLRKGHGLDLVDDGICSRGRRGSTLWVFWNKSALRADLRVFQSVGCRALGCVVPRGPQKHLFAGPWGASYRGEVTKDARAHLRKGHGLDLVDDGTRSRGRRGSTLWVFWNKSALRADLRVFQSVGCRALGCVVPRGAQKHALSWPLGSIVPSGGHKGRPGAPPQGAWA